MEIGRTRYSFLGYGYPRISARLPYADLGYGVLQFQQIPCGEIPLCPYDSCRLIAINLYSMWITHFTEQANLISRSSRSHVRLSQRIMDDIIDLELEKIDAIYDKIVADPEMDEIKQVELNLWEKIKEKAVNGRRTGIGTGSFTGHEETDWNQILRSGKKVS